MDFTLQLGETVKVRRSILTTWSVTYAGSPAEGRYSLVVAWSAGHQASSYNLFLTASTRRVSLERGTIHIHEASPERIRFRYERM